MSGTSPGGSFSLVLCAALLNHAFSGVAFPMVTAQWIGLFTSHPTNAGGTEVAAADYVRMQANFTRANPAAVPTVTNISDLLWPAAQVDWGTIVGMGAFSLATGGMYLGFSPLLDATLTVPVVQFIGAGDQMRVPPTMFRARLT